MLEELLPVVLAASGLDVSAFLTAGFGAFGFLGRLFGTGLGSLLHFRLFTILAVGLFLLSLLFIGFSGHFDRYFPPVPACAVQGFDHLVGFGLVHFEEREVTHQVDASQVDTAFRVAVDEADEVCGEEVVCLADVDEKACEAGFGLAAAVLLSFAALVAFLFFLGADGLFSVSPYTNGWRTYFPFFGKSAKRNQELGGIIKNKCYLCNINKNRVVQPT